MRWLYVLLAYLLAPLIVGVMLWRGLKDRSYWQHFDERFGFGRAPFAGESLWVHAVSVGEVQAAAALVGALRERHPELPIVLTTVTPTGAERARARFRDGVHVRYVPYDLPGSVRRFFDRIRPRAAIILETELWPNLYHECGRRGVPLVLASARISPRSVSRYRRLAGLFRETLSHGIVIAAQSEGDAERFRSIGANPQRTHVTGNIKFDFPLPADLPDKGAALRARHAAGRPTWVAGSTHAGEEETVIAVQAALSGSPRPLLVLVPRHPGRFDEVAALLERRGLCYVRHSSGAACTAQTEVLLVDTLGELMQFYASADLAFVGGSLVPVGGHNLLEPAALGLATLTGPHNFNAQEIADMLIEAGAVQVVSDETALREGVEALLRDPTERARRGQIGREAVERNRGALARLLTLIDPVLQRPAAERAERGPRDR
jgi:3-deoxy-D-manno-octulosonic-acid transferase